MNAQTNSTMKESVNAILAHSYLSYFISFLLGLFSHFILPIKIYDEDITTWAGLIILALATCLIIWAQASSRKLHDSEISKDSFCRGPYCYTRTPTQWGLLFLMIGFSLMINSLMVALFTLVFFILSKVTFIKKQESLLLKRYGEAYMQYKKSVKF